MKSSQTPSPSHSVMIKPTQNSGRCWPNSCSSLNQSRLPQPLLFLLITFLSLGISLIQAVALTWTPTTSSWPTSGNWLPPGPPTAIDAADFLGSGTGPVDLNNGGAGNTANGLFFNATTPNYFIEDTYNDFNSFTEPLTIASSMMQSGANTVTFANTVLTCPTLTVNSGGFEFQGTNTATFTTANINGGIVCVLSYPPSAITAGNWNVGAGATLKGTGLPSTTVAGSYSTLIGNINVAAGGTLLAGCSPGTCNIQGNVVFAAGAQSVFELAVPNVVGGGSDLFNIDGDLTLNATFDIVAVTGFGAGNYRLINYSGTLINNGVTLGNLPVGYAAQLDFSTTNQVNLMVYSAGDCCPSNNAPIVCYTNTVYPGYNLLANHLCLGTNNSLNAVLPNVPEGSELMTWDPNTQSYNQPSYYSSGAWYNSDFSALSSETLEPSEGFFLNNPSGTAYTLVICGKTPSCPPPCLTNTAGYKLVGRLGIGTASWTNLSSCPPTCGTEVNVWNPLTQSYSNHIYGAAGWSPSVPVVGIGQSAFVKIGTDTNCTPCTNNLVINGSFENPVVPGATHDQFVSMPGWTATHFGSPTTFEVWKGGAFAMTPQDGNQHLEINSATNNVTVSQVITNVSTNCTAKFCFWYAGRPSYANNFQLQILGSGLAPVDFNPPSYTGPSSWQQYCVEFTPVSTTLTIQFTGTSGAALAGAHIDNVSLMQCCTNPPCDEPLVVNCSTNKTVNCGSAWQFDAPTASSLCCPITPTVSVFATWTNGVCPKVATRIWQITDCFTNSTTCTQTVTVVDTTLPVVNCPGNIVTYTCDTSNKVYFAATAKDACSGTLPVTYSHASGSLFPVGNTTVTATATDACGNVGSCTFIVSVKQHSMTGWRYLGVKDNGTLPIETAPRSSYLNSLYSGTWNNFDTKYAGRPFGASFLKLPKNLTCATLEIWLKPYRKSFFSNASQNDTITIRSASSVLVNSPISALGGSFSPWLLQSSFQKYTITFSPAQLAAININNQLDIFVQDSTIVDYARLTYCYCFDLDKFGGVDVSMNNGVLVNGPQFTSLKPIPDVTNYTATVLPGATKGIRLGLPVKQLGFLTNATLSANAEVNGQSTDTSVTLTGVGNGNVSLALTSIPAEVTQLQLTLKRNGVIVGQSTQPASNGAPSITWMNDGVEVASGQQGLIWMEDMWEISTVANLGSSGQDGVSIRTPSVGGIGSSGQDGVESIVVMNDGVHNIGTNGQDGVEFNLGSSGQDGLINLGSSGQDGVEFTVRMRNPSSIQTSVLPDTLADTVTLKFVNPNHTSDTLLTSVTLGADGLSEVQLSGIAVKMGELWAQSIGDVSAAVDGEQVSVTAHDPSATNRFGILIHLPVTNAASINLSELNNSTASNGIVNVVAYGIVGSNLVDVARASIIGDDWGWGIETSFSTIGSSNELYQVYNHGVLVASLTFHGTPHVPVLPALLSTTDSGTKWIYEWATDGSIAINGSNYLGNELRISAVAPAALPTSVRFLGIGSSGQDGVSIAGETPARDWIVLPLDWDAEDLHIQWSGPRGGAVESAPALNGPWTIVPNQNAYSATMPSPESTNAASAQFFRVRSN